MIIFTIHSVFPRSNRKIWETTLILLLVSCWQCCVVGFVSSSGVGRWPQRNQPNLEVTKAKADQKLYIRNTIINRSLDKSILIVENDNDLRKAIGKFLAKGGYHVTGVADARSAMLVCRGIVRPVNSSRTRFKLDPNFTRQHFVGHQSIISTKNSTLSIVPDCLVLDIQLGGSVDGLGLLNIIRSDPVLASLPVVLLTAKGKVEDRIIGYESDADAYLPKPFEPEELLSIIDGLLLRENVTSSTEQYGKKKSNIVYRDLKRELTEIKNLLNLNAPSNGMSMATDNSLQRDILEIKNKLKDLVVDQTPQFAKPMKYDSISILSPVETQIIKLVAQGLTNKNVANEMECSISKIEKHVTSMMKMANVKNRVDLVDWWGAYSRNIEQIVVPKVESITSEQNTIDSLTIEETVGE